MSLIELKPGTSVEGDLIPAFKSEHKSLKYLYLIAGVHGDEVEGIYILKQLIEWINETDEDTPLPPMVIVPILNIDGHRTNSRVNSHGVDLNRNLASESWSKEFKESKYNPGAEALSEPENQYLVKLFNKYPPALIISLHSWKPMLNYNGECKEVADFLNQHNSYPSKDSVGYPTPGSLGDFGPEKYSAPVLTFESPQISDDKNLQEIWNENMEGLTSLLTSDLIKSFF